MPRSARKSRIHAAIGRFLTSMLPSNRVQHGYKHSPECTAIVVKHSRRRDWSTCRKRIQDLPYELRAMIMDQYFEAILVPGEIEPVPCKAHRGSDCFLYNKSSFWCRDALRIMGSKEYNRYQQRYWSENTLVSRSRTFSRVKCTYFLQQIVRSREHSPDLTTLKRLPTEMIGSIRSVRIVLGGPHIKRDLSAFEYNMRYPRMGWVYNREHLPRWWHAAVNRSRLTLRHLVIDVREAYSTDGRWMGRYWTTRLLRPRRYVPENYEVIGPNPGLEQEVRCWIDDNIL